MTSQDSHPRESIWSVRQEDRPRFSCYFAILFVIGMAWVVWYQIDYVAHDSLVETIMAIFIGTVQAGVAAVTITFFRFEGEDAMGIALDIWREKRRKEREAMISETVDEIKRRAFGEFEAVLAENKTLRSENEELKRIVSLRDENEALKRRIAELEKSNGDASSQS